MLTDIYIIMRDFYEKSTYQMSKNRGRIITTQGAHASLVGILSFLHFYLSLKSLEEEIQQSGDRVDTARG